MTVLMEVSTAVNMELLKKMDKKLLRKSAAINSTSFSNLNNNDNHSSPLSGFVILIAKNNCNNVTIYGTPADRAGLAVGDEIIEVNNVPVEGKEHAEIVTLIHKDNDKFKLIAKSYLRKVSVF
uniref:PDZ domain-containing protein n=1 Tax=Syphacia muris TaxID=451379 RepID=A0A0N5AH04_9BILA